MKKAFQSALACLLTLCLLVTPFSGVLVFAQAGPFIEFSVSNFDYVLADTPITVTMTANGAATLTACDTLLEGVSLGAAANVTFPPDEKSLANGKYTLVAKATDSNGETTIKAVTFVVTDTVNIDFTYAEDESIVPTVDGATAVYHEVTPLDYTAGYGSTADGNVSFEDVIPYGQNNTILMQYYGNGLSNSSTSGIPYQTFDVALNGKTDGEVAVRYTGSTYAAERIALKVYNPTTLAWDTLGTIMGSDSISASVDVATYADNDVIHVMAILDYVINGSDTMIWSTDPQHYTKFDDLNDYYYQVYQYAAEQYKAGNVGYIITTGDLVDDLPSTAVAAKQWQVADQAMSYVEEVGMPNGLVSGNHDVKTYNKPDYSAGAPDVDYSKYTETFPASRYNDKPWYGGSLNNNTSHYDLITIGNVDFIVMYLGYGVEATDETIAWANDVLQMYSHRTAIITTHQYLDAATADRSPKSRAQLIFDKIADPNPNVKMILCGHDDGSILNEVEASDGRIVYELLSDYQFVEAEDPSFYANEHYIGSVPHCCGDGYIRLMTVDGTTLSSITYSPVTGRYNPYGDRENVSIDLNCGQPSRSIDTVNFSAYIVGDEIAAEEAYNYANAIVITLGDNTIYHHVSYTDYPAYPEATANTPADLVALEDLIAYAESLDVSAYTEQSAEYLEIVLGDVKAIDTTDASEVSLAYFLLSRMLGAMKTPVDVIDESKLVSIHNYDMTPSKWATSDTTKTALEGTGFKLSRNTKNGWASVNSSDSYAIKANNGKVYVKLDVDADCSWSVHLAVSQANSSGTIVINHAVDNAFNRIDCDSMNGVYNGVYDITEAFEKFGMDPSATINVSKTYLYLVPGEGSTQYTDLATNPDTVDYRYLELLTEASEVTEIDYTALQELIEECEALDETIYTVGSWKKLQAAVAVAKNALTNTTYEQADINLEVIKLENAVAKLKLVVDIIPEPEGSLLPADEGNWVEYSPGTTDIYRDDNNYTIIRNTNNQWPSVSYTYPEALTYTVADHQISVDMTVAGNSRVDLLVGSTWVNIGKYITGNKMNGEDMLGGEFKVDIPLSNVFATETVAISAIRVYSIGNSASSAVTIRQMQITDYVAPPSVEDKKLDLIPESDEEWTLVSGEGTINVENGVLTAVNTGDVDLRLTLNNAEYFNLEKLNSLHMDFSTDVPFKMAVQVTSVIDGSSQWLNTSANYPSLFTIENDGAAAGDYDVQMEIRDLSTSIKDKSSCYFQQFIILVKGKGTFTLNIAEMVPNDTYQWNESMTTYGPAATPLNPYFAHAAKTAPEVSEKFDILEAIKYPAHPTVNSWVTIGNSSTAPLGLEIDISKTPYLYYSFAMSEGSSFTFGMYNNSNYAPWFTFLDSSKDTPFINQSIPTWDSYTDKGQYATNSQTGCIDMRTLLKTSTEKWIINQITFYPVSGSNVVLSYLFFGSEPINDAHVHNTIHFDAVEPGCHYIGNIEYWYCPDCEGFWQDEALTQVTNSKNVILPATGEGNVIHFDASEPGCHDNGRMEYWYCSDCEQFWQDEALTQLTNSKRVLLPAVGSENLVHVEAVKPTTTENGNVEYWYCPDCDRYFLDEACTQLTTRLSVILPALDTVIGDIDGDGFADTNDATRLFYAVNGMVELTEDELLVADTNGDGIINLYDVARLFYFINDIIAEL